ncbi:MAG: SGNH/GDSL hydrolase family protein [Deltaproteobacteria bacterium]
MSAATALGMILCLELLFPSILPGEYAQIRELSKGFHRASRDDLRWFSVVFTSRPHTHFQTASHRTDRRPNKHTWHVPGEESEYYGYEPNGKFKYLNIIFWNAHGYFDRDYDYRKPPGVYRIVFIGDSYVEALQVPLRRSFHKLLETSLNQRGARRTGPARKFEVIALGHSGTGQEQNLKSLKKEATLYHPDLVAFTLCSNDFCDDDAALRRERNLATGEISPEFRGLVRHGYLMLAFALRRFNEIEMNRYKISPELLQWSAEDVPRVEEAWHATLERVRAGRDFCRSRGIEFVLVYLGSELEVKYALDPQGAVAELGSMHSLSRNLSWDMAKSLSRVTRYCRKHNIHVISLLEPLVVAQRQTGKQVFGDHYTMFAHKVVAKSLSTALTPTLLTDLPHKASARK